MWNKKVFRTNDKNMKTKLKMIMKFRNTACILLNMLENTTSRSSDKIIVMEELGKQMNVFPVQMYF